MQFSEALNRVLGRDYSSREAAAGVSTERALVKPVLRFVGNQRFFVSHVSHLHRRAFGTNVAPMALGAIKPCSGAATITNKKFLLHKALLSCWGRRRLDVNFVFHLSRRVRSTSDCHLAAVRVVGGTRAAAPFAPTVM
jgi:hypothetical protein